MNPFNKTAVLFTLAASLVATAIVAPAAGALSAHAVPSDAANVRVVASLKLGVHTIEFVDDGSGVIGVGEDAPGSAPTLLSQLTTRDVSALEIFMALAPEKSAPAALKADHSRTVKLQRRSSSSPRALTLVLPPSAAPGAGAESYVGGECEYQEAFVSDSLWAQNWHFDHDDKDYHNQASYFPKDVGGLAGRAWSPGPSSVRWLGACNGNFIFGHEEFAFRAERQSGGSWVTSYYRQVSYQHQVVYWSFAGSENWRVRLSEVSYNVLPPRMYAVGVAKNAPFGLAPNPGN